MLAVECYKVGVLKTNCYLIKDPDSNFGIIIDPGGQSLALEEKIKNLKIKYILLTHGHFDHILKASKYRLLTGAKIVIGKLEKDFLRNNDLNISKTFYQKGMEAFEADIYVNDLDIINFGSHVIKVMNLPGHTAGSVCYIIEDCIFLGDTIFKNGVGRVDLPTGDAQALSNSIRKIYNLKHNYFIYPGHGEFTSVFEEKNRKKIHNI